MVANVYKIFYNPNYLLIFFFILRVYFFVAFGDPQYKTAIWASVLCMLLLFVLAGFYLCLGWLLSLSWLALGCLGDYCRGIAATNLTPFDGFLLLGAFGVIFGLLAEKL